MKISVIIVAYKSGDILVKCLDSIAKYNDIEDELEVIVVDNSPEDERIERDLAKSQYKNYRYIPSDNRGFGAGNNQGVDISTGEILAFLNPDIILIEPIFKKVWEKFQKEKDVTYLFIAHDLSIVRFISDRIGVIYKGRIVEVADAEELFEYPLHPYTQGLLKSKPSVNGNETRLYSIPGQVPNPVGMPDNCYFNERCDRCMEKCKDVQPTLVDVGNRHKVSCWLYKEGK